MKLKTKFIIIGFFIFLINFPLHFLYEVFPNFITSLLSPVNESIFEHMKMIFTSFWMGAIVFYFFNRDKDFFSILCSFLISSIVCMGGFLIIYIPIFILFQENLIVTLILEFISIFLSLIVGYYILNLIKIKYQKWISFGILLIFYLLIYYLTYYPPHTLFFMDIETNTYGLPNT
jgi:hypothetical protein